MLPFVRAQLDYYAILGVAPSAPREEISAAFRRLAWRYHPDRNPAPGSTLQFQDINEAHQVLSNPARRAEYDAQWHSKPADHGQATRPAIPPRPRRGWRRHRQQRAVLLTLFAGLLVTSAWAAIFTAMNVARSGSFSQRFDSPPALAAAPPECTFSLEMSPVTYSDERGRKLTTWQTRVHNCWGGSIAISSLPETHFVGSSRLSR